MHVFVSDFRLIWIIVLTSHSEFQRDIFLLLFNMKLLPSCWLQYAQLLTRKLLQNCILRNTTLSTCCALALSRSIQTSYKTQLVLCNYNESTCSFVHGIKNRALFFRWLSCWNPGPSSLLSSSACSCVSGHLWTPILLNQRIPEITLLRRNSPNITPRWDTTSTSSRDNGEKDTCKYACLLKMFSSPHPSDVDQVTMIKMIPRWCHCTISH